MTELKVSIAGTLLWLTELNLLRTLCTKIDKHRLIFRGMSMWRFSIPLKNWDYKWTSSSPTGAVWWLDVLTHALCCSICQMQPGFCGAWSISPLFRHTLVNMVVSSLGITLSSFSLTVTSFWNPNLAYVLNNLAKAISLKTKQWLPENNFSNELII